MNKKELKDGMIVVTRDNTKLLVCNYKLIGCNTSYSLSDYHNNLYRLQRQETHLDINEVYKFTHFSDGFNEGLNCVKSIGALIWKRNEEEIDWTTIPRYTKVQVADNPSNDWHNAYFLAYDDSDIYYPYVVTFEDLFISETQGVNEESFKYIRLHGSSYQ